MSSAAIPKEQLTAYQRWELDSFDAPKEVPLGDKGRPGGVSSEYQNQPDASRQQKTGAEAPVVCD